MSVVKDYKSLRSHRTADIKVFLMEGSRAGSGNVQIFTDPYPEAPKFMDLTEPAPEHCSLFYIKFPM
jgi:hypothetical protein